ncbi:MAG: pesticidal protein Cry7Aa, partial [Candidatus Nealsonbacteria bacterium]|nr:pesticidal protein Cry7Aa [Candidatus Nealsonbacteria bacterium]
ARLEGPFKVIERWEKPIIYREYEYERLGVEDPRIVKIDNTFYLFYVAHDGKNAVTCYATSQDLKAFKKMGIISPQITYSRVGEILRGAGLKDTYSFHAALYEKLGGKDILLWAKDTFLFPRKIDGKFFLITRVLPDIQIICFNDFKELTTEFWENFLKNLPKHVILENKHWFETRHIGGGCPPIETKDGWILIYHGVEAKNIGRVYHTCAVLLDKKNPLKVIGRLHEPLFSPTEKWEKSGFIPDVVFATGTAVFDDTLYIYYGAADQRVAVASVNINELLLELRKFPGEPATS